MTPGASKPYLYVEELAALTPWSVEAIRKKVQRGRLQRGVHYFQEARRDRLIFKWAAIVDLIESSRGATSEGDRGLPRAESTRVLSVEEATERLRRLRG